MSGLAYIPRARDSPAPRGHARASDWLKGMRPSPGRAAKIAGKLGEPEAFWIKLALQDLLRKEKINLSVSVA